MKNNISKSDSVLDYGCADGKVSSYIIPFCKSLDLYDPYTKYNQPHKDKYDVVLLIQILEHIKDGEEFLKYISTITPKVIIEIPILDWQNNMLIKLGYKPVDDKGHRHFYTKETFRNLIKRCGWRITKEEESGLLERAVIEKIIK